MERRYSFKNLMERLTSDCWFVIEDNGRFFFAQMVI